MRKNALRYLVPCMAMALCSISFTSCSDDDEGGVPSGPSITFGGENLMSVDDYIFWYDGNGRCYKVSDGWNDDVVEIDYETGMIRSDDLGTEMNISFNSKGYITSLSASWNHRGLFIQVGCQNIFNGKRGHAENYFDYGVYDTFEKTVSRNLGANVYVSLSYSFDFGRQVQRQDVNVDTSSKSGILK